MVSPASKTVPQGQKVFDFVGHKFPGLFDGLTKVLFVDGPKSSHASVGHHEIPSIVLEKPFDPGLSPILTIERPLIYNPGVNPGGGLGNDLEGPTHHFHDLAVIVDLVSTIMFVDVNPWCPAGARHGEPNEGVFTFNER